MPNFRSQEIVISLVRGQAQELVVLSFLRDSNVQSKLASLRLLVTSTRCRVILTRFNISLRSLFLAV